MIPVHGKNQQDYEDQKPFHMSCPSLSLSLPDPHQLQLASLIPGGGNPVNFSHPNPIHQGDPILGKKQPCLDLDHAIAGIRDGSSSFGLMGCTCCVQPYGNGFGINSVNEVREAEAAASKQLMVNIKERDRYERTLRRMIKNRESAARSRERKLAYIAQLQKEIMKLKKENEILRRTIQLYSVETTSKVQPSIQRTMVRVTGDASNDDSELITFTNQIVDKATS